MCSIEADIKRDAQGTVDIHKMYSFKETHAHFALIYRYAL
jgi:hypothetical protein